MKTSDGLCRRVFIAVSIDDEAAFGTKDGHTFYWSGGTSWSTYPGDEFLLSIYTSDYEESILAFLKEHASLSTGAAVSAGWLAPDGAFYHCADYWGHAQLACKLMALHYGKLGDDRDLEERNYVRVYRDGTVVLPPNLGGLLQPQLDTLFDFSQLPNAPTAWVDGMKTIVTVYGQT